MSNTPLRPPMPMDDMRSGPPSPYDMDPRMDRDSRDPRTMGAPFDRLGVDGPEYFSAMGNFGSRPGGSPYPPPGFDPEMMMGGGPQHIDEVVRRTNLLVQFVNGQISPSARYSQLQPKMCSDGKFPNEFRAPRTIEEIRAMDPSMLDRILRAYGLPTDLRSLRMTSNDPVGPRVAHQARLCTLFDHLGAVQISDRQRMKRAGMCYPH